MMRLLFTFLTSIWLLMPLVSWTQVDGGWFPKNHRKGNAYAGFGWNRSHYSPSDIRFTGDGYDFTLLNASANDRQSEFSTKLYFTPNTITIPQTNMRFGYFLTDNIAVSFGVDHMKYVLVEYVDVEFTGYFSDTTYMDLLHDGSIYLDNAFLNFEHTDGLNYLNFEIEYFKPIYHLPKFQFNALAGAGLGAMMPKSNVTLMCYPRSDVFHFAGYGMSAKIGLEFVFFKYFFIKAEMKEGFINMPDILTRGAEYTDRASQHFFFTEWDGMFGVNFPLVTKKEVPVEK